MEGPGAQQDVLLSLRVSSVTRGWDTDHRATQLCSKTRTTLIANIFRVSWAVRLFQAQLPCWELCEITSRHSKRAIFSLPAQGLDVSHEDYSSFSTGSSLRAPSPTLRQKFLKSPGCCRGLDWQDTRRNFYCYRYNPTKLLVERVLCKWLPT